MKAYLLVTCVVIPTLVDMRQANNNRQTAGLPKGSDNRGFGLHVHDNIDCIMKYWANMVHITFLLLSPTTQLFYCKILRRPLIALFSPIISFIEPRLDS